MMFNVTYEIVTHESAEHGDAERRGYAGVELGLRDAIRELFDVETCQTGCIEAIEPNCSNVEDARWVTVYNGMQYETGARESRSLHFPENLTVSTKRRIMRLVMKG